MVNCFKGVIYMKHKMRIRIIILLLICLAMLIGPIIGYLA